MTMRSQQQLSAVVALGIVLGASALGCGLEQTRGAEEIAADPKSEVASKDNQKTSDLDALNLDPSWKRAYREFRSKNVKLLPDDAQVAAKGSGQVSDEDLAKALAGEAAVVKNRRGEKISFVGQLRVTRWADESVHLLEETAAPRRAKSLKWLTDLGDRKANAKTRIREFLQALELGSECEPRFDVHDSWVGQAGAPEAKLLGTSGSMVCVLAGTTAMLKMRGFNFSAAADGTLESLFLNWPGYNGIDRSGMASKFMSLTEEEALEFFAKHIRNTEAYPYDRVDEINVIYQVRDGKLALSLSLFYQSPDPRGGGAGFVWIDLTKYPAP